MRIVGGTHRGRPIVAPKGHLTRPTADRTRQAIFDVLEHAPWSPGVTGARVLDLFAGSGALGLEALSRGAKSCLFIDHAPAARGAIAANLARLGWRDRGAARLADVALMPSRSASDAPCSLVFLDPPYGRNLASLALARLLSERWLADEAIVAVEREAGAGALDLGQAWEGLDARRWGVARVDFIKRRKQAEGAATSGGGGRLSGS